MYVIKQQAEDFKVTEIPNREWNKEGSFLVIKVTKTNWNTEDIVSEIARQIHVKPSAIAYAGTKDRNAITTQFMSVRGGHAKWFEKVTIKDAKIEVRGYTNEPLSLGSLLGNRFEIVVRNLQEGQHVHKTKIIPNKFGPQRFGKQNQHIGKAILQRDFKKACEMIIEDESRQKELIEKTLSVQENNYVGALQNIPRKILLLYLHSYQSSLFNKELELALKEKKAEELVGETLPLIGFGTDEDEAKVLESEGLSTRSFVLKELPEMSIEGTRREAMLELTDLQVGEEEDDELNKGMKKRTVMFSLPKGAYATVVVEAVFS